MPTIFVLALLAALFTLAGFSIHWLLGVAELFLLLLAGGFTWLHARRMQQRMYHALQMTAHALDPSHQTSLAEFPIPCVVCGENGLIIWYNELFRTRVLNNKDIMGEPSGNVLAEFSLQELNNAKVLPVDYNGRMYTVYCSQLQYEKAGYYALYFVDDTQLKRISFEYTQSRPAVMMIAVDSIDELLQNARESEKAAVMGGIEIILENWIGQTTGLLRRLNAEKFIAVVEERHLKRMIEERFNVLDQVRDYTYGNRKGATLSIGVGRGASYGECEEMAGQALDMAFGRGGDQAVVKTKSAYEFFGGISKGVEKRTKVRTRIIASAVMELIEGSDNILIMGHGFADLDAFGASVGLWKAAKSLGKSVYVVMTRSKSQALPLLGRIEEQGVTDMVISPEKAITLVNKRTLLMVVDTHRPDFVESPELLSICKTVVVIDHHRKTVDHINDAVIFYHEPFASSASEMVAELLQYMSSKPIIDRMEAEALLAGIMLDTRNFVLRTGVRTFEAAAYLRGRGADMVAVKRLFSNSMEDYQIKSSVVANMEIYRNCAIAIADSTAEDIRVISSQAADELLNINGVIASFVLFRADNRVHISARSLGNVNVQIIMETVGGGGHHTMAAAQLDNITISDARVRLLEAIDFYYAQNVKAQ